jgi:two-component system, sensor histidine kinase ChiS
MLTILMEKLTINTQKTSQKSQILSYLTSLITLITVLAIVAIIDHSEKERFQQGKRAEALQQLSTARAKLEKGLNQRLFLERGLVAHISAVNPNITQSEFENLGSVITSKIEGINSIALYKNSIVSHMYPLKGYEAAIGFEPMKIPAEKEAINRAISTRKTVVAGPVKVFPKGIAFISRTPVFLTPKGGQAESGEYWGLVGIIIDKDVLYKEAGLLDKNAPLKYVIRGKDGLGEKGEVFFGEPQLLQQNPVTTEVTLPNGKWQLAAIPTEGWQVAPPISKWLWIGGGLMSVFAGGLVYILVSTPARLKIAIEEATRALKDSENALKSANNELQRLDRIKDEFLANTSHELRTPLNGIIGIAESLIDGVTGNLGEPTINNLNMIVASGRRLSSLVNDILDFSKLKNSNIELQIKPVGMREIAEIVIKLSGTLIINKKLQLINNIHPETPLVNADENRLQQILYNLVGNAIKFTEKGTIEISAEIHENNYLAITVSDTGIGIPEDKFSKIFQSFEQADGSTAREYGGTGLGLAITKQLVELHGGTIDIKSTVGLGSKFIFTLPIAGTEDLKIPVTLAFKKDLPIAKEILYIDNVEKPVIKKDYLQETADKFKILIVDDEPVNLQVLVNHLSLQNYAITQATNGIEALEIIDKGFKPDLILLDVMMPKMTGYEVTEKLRERFSASELPILLLTAKTQVKDLVTGFDIGANDYLAKPINKDELIARIKTHINLTKLRAENMRMGAELAVTRRMQKMLLPPQSELNKITELELAGFMEPAEEVGGDYYDVLSHNGQVKIAMGDVTGHGLESGVLMIMVQTAMRTLLSSEETDSQRFLDVLNRTIYDNVQRMNSDKSLTLVMADYQDKKLHISGQHEEIILIRNNGEIERIDTIDLGFPIGLDSDIINFISSTEIELNTGDVVVFYTDGITEAENINKQHYGLERLIQTLQKNHHQSAEEIRKIVIDDVQAHIGTQKVYDDITLLVIKQK